MKNKFTKIICALFILLSGLSFSYAFFPLHDTMASYQFFSVAMSALYFNGEILQWLPFTAYGVNADWYFYNCLTVFKYFFIAIATLLRIEHAFIVYKISLLFEQAVFVFGVYKLSSRIFNKSATIIFVTICAAGSVVLDNQVAVNFYSYYLLPLVIYYMYSFFDEQKTSSLILSLLILILSIPGQANYFLPIYFLELSPFIIVLGSYYYIKKKQFPRMQNKEALLTLLYLAFFIVTFGSLIYGSFNSLANYKTLSTGRDPVTKHILLDNFLTYGGQIGFGKFTDLIVPNVLMVNGNVDTTMYIGLLALPFVVFACIKVREPLFIAIATSAIVMLLFSLGGYFSTFTYHVIPGMKYARHIGLSVAVFKLYLPLLAGFGIDRALSENTGRIYSHVLLFLVIPIVLLAEAGMYLWISHTFTYYKPIAIGYTACMLLVVLTTFMHKNMTITLVLAVCLEMLCYQSMVHKKYALWKPGTIPDGFSRIERISYSPVRTDFPVNERTKELVPLTRALLSLPFASYNIYYNFIQHDNCVNTLRVDFINNSVSNMLEARGGVARNFSIMLPYNDKLTLNSIACTAPKLRLTTDVMYAQNLEESISLLKNLSSDDGRIILNDIPPSLHNIPSSGNTNGTVEVTEFSFNKLTARVNILQNDGAWLYYADSYHPSWKSTVNKQPAKVYQANVGFKALYLPVGSNDVCFYVENPLPARISVISIIAAGLSFTIVLLIWMLRTIMHKQ